MKLPEGFEAEFVPIMDATSMTNGYNRAMSGTDAKYKVYLHQDLYIFRATFISDLVRLFQNNPRLGMLGVVGAAKLPVSGIWWESPARYGKIIDSHSGQLKLLPLGEIAEEYQQVTSLDGCILMTQYDLPWREDLFTGWHFYDQSQCIEFIRAGYQIGIPKQTSPWVVHDCGVVVMSNYEEFRHVFLREYGPEIRAAE